MMNDKAAAARRAYKREWSRRNPDKVKAAQERYWIRRYEREAAEAAKEDVAEPAGGEVGDQTP